MRDIFISYKREERAKARKLANALGSQGWKVWWDPKLRTGERFDDVIAAALDEVKCVVVMWSRRSVNSEYVKDEAAWALRRNKLVPIMIEAVTLPFRFEGIHTASFVDWDGSETSTEFQDLVNDIAAIAGAPMQAEDEQHRQGDIFTEFYRNSLDPEREQELLNLWSSERITSEQRVRITRLLFEQGCVDITKDAPATRSGTALALKFWASTDSPLKTTYSEIYDAFLKRISKSDLSKMTAARLILPIDIANVLAQDENSEIRWCLARSAHVPQAVLEQLSLDRDEQVRGSVADNPNSPVWVLTRLAQDNNGFVRSQVSKNPAIELSLLLQLADDKDSIVLNSVLTTWAQNVNTPASLLLKLAKSPDEMIRRDVAQNPSTPIGALETLAADTDWFVRSAAAGNRNTPVTLVESLIRDDHPSVRWSAGENPSISVTKLRQWAQDRDKDVRRGVADNPNTPVDLLEQLSSDRERIVRQTVAANGKTPRNVFERLATDRNKYVLYALAGNTELPTKVFELLVSKKDKEIRKRLAYNVKTPGRLLERFANDKNREVRCFVAHNPNTPIPTLQELFKQTLSRIDLIKGETECPRDAVATNVNCCLEWF